MEGSEDIFRVSPTSPLPRTGFPHIPASPGSHLLWSVHWAQLSAGVEELIVPEERALGSWLQGTDCKWAIPETEQGTEKDENGDSLCSAGLRH